MPVRELERFHSDSGQVYNSGAVKGSRSTQPVVPGPATTTRNMGCACSLREVTPRLHRLFTLAREVLRLKSMSSNHSRVSRFANQSRRNGDVLAASAGLLFISVCG
jgi:hypothetical protein